MRDIASRKVAVVACMDARLGECKLSPSHTGSPTNHAHSADPAKILGLQEGDAHVIRNAGGRTIEALRSLIISQQLLGTREIVIVHHVCEPLNISTFITQKLMLSLD
jgi:carbonic anhydrase